MLIVLIQFMEQAPNQQACGGFPDYPD